MSSPPPARAAVVLGLTALTLAVVNQVTAPTLEPPLERASVLAGLLAVLLMLAGALWQRITPAAPQRVSLEGRQGFELADALPAALREELAWGSAMLLKATPAAVVLLQRGNRTLLRRGLLVESPFRAGPICGQALQRQRPISLVNLGLYPGRDEFAALLPELPAVVVQPVGTDAVLLLGGWSPRCFGRSDLIWIEGWAERLALRLAAAEAEFGESLSAMDARPPGEEPGNG